jgi:lysophospholipase L1-like esterase
MTKIMPLGDSITQGQNTGYGSYRRLLYTLLTDSGITVDFVGPLSDGTFADPDHAGYTGEYVDSIWARVEIDLIVETYAPDIILLITGTNDIWHVGGPSGGNPATALGTLGSLLNAITTFGGADAKVLVGSIPPIATFVGGSTVTSNVNVYNAGIPAVVAAAGTNFSFVDINAGLTTADLADGVHPTDAGNDKIANIWAPAVLEALGAVRLLDEVGAPLTDESGNFLVSFEADEEEPPPPPPPAPAPRRHKYFAMQV